MKRVGEARFFRNLFNQCVGLLQAFGGMVHFESKQVLVRALVVVAPEQTADIGIIDMTFFGDLLQRPQPQAVLFDMLAALLESGKGMSLQTFERRTRPGNPQRQTFEKFRAQISTLAAYSKSGLNEFVKERLHGARWKSLRNAAGR